MAIVTIALLASIAMSMVIKRSAAAAGAHFFATYYEADGHAGKAEAEYNGSDDYCEQNIHNVMLPEGD